MKDVAYNLKERIRQELAFPAVVHFYTWLLQGVRIRPVLRWLKTFDNNTFLTVRIAPASFCHPACPVLLSFRLPLGCKVVVHALPDSAGAGRSLHIQSMAQDIDICVALQLLYEAGL